MRRRSGSTSRRFTVKKHLENIYGKLGVRNRTEAIGKAQSLGWLERAGA